MTTTEISSPPKRRLRSGFLISLAAFAATVALFYAEEDWRGLRARAACLRELKTQGVSLDWTPRIPAVVPENENVFGVPEMQKWFVKTDAPTTNELTRKLHYPAYDSTARMVVAQITAGLPGMTAPNGATVLQWGDGQANAGAARLIKEALGPTALDPVGYVLMLRKPEEIRPKQIFFQGQIAPTTNALLGFLPSPIVNTLVPSREDIRVEPKGDGTFNVTMETPINVADFLQWSETMEPEFDLIRRALKRPYSRINGDYSVPSEMPIPNFVALRIVSQRLAAMAECHLLLDQPQDALANLTLINDICRRVPEDARPVTLVSAMINVAIRGLYANVIADGLKEHAWREQQLAALEGQLEQINLLAAVKPGFDAERLSVLYHLNTLTPAQYFKLFHYYRDHTRKNTAWTAFKDWESALFPDFIPRGWCFQNMAPAANLYTTVMSSLDPASQMVFPDKLDAFERGLNAIASHWSPFTFIALPHIANFTRAAQVAARNQTIINQARIACALECYCLIHGAYPPELNDLVPQFLDTIPHDVIGGRLPRYRLNADGTFLLYSIGWSQQDHGGNVGDGSMKNSDFVWPEK